MTFKMRLVALALFAVCGVCHAEERWTNFAEDSDVKYYLDQKSVTTLPDNVYIFWVKSIPKEKDFFKKEYNLNNLAYILTNYELDCAVSSYRVRGTIMFDKNRRELNKSLSTGVESPMEPVPPESMLELAQDEICSRANLEKGEQEQPSAAPPAAEPSLQPAQEPPTIQ